MLRKLFTISSFGINGNGGTITINDQNIITVKSYDYLLAKTLKMADPELHRRYKETVFGVQNILSRYRLLFPEYTDHSELHSMTVIDSCNRLIGEEQIQKLNADELYILLMASYLHDVGMGISEKDYEEFKDSLGAGEYFSAQPEASKADFVRDLHNEFSGLFIDKYAGVFDIPSRGHLFAIKQVARGHRKTDLFDEEEYPSYFRLPNGNPVCLPYLAAIIRIADEIDVVASRNPIILYDLGLLIDPVEIVENKKVQAIKSLKMTSDAFILTAETDEEDIYTELKKMTKKMQMTLDLCRDVIAKRSPYKLSQERVVLNRV